VMVVYRLFGFQEEEVVVGILNSSTGPVPWVDCQRRVVPFVEPAGTVAPVPGSDSGSGSGFVLGPGSGPDSDPTLPISTAG
jgi:hypothetical protein